MTAETKPIYIPCVNGALYKNPLLRHPGGLVTFSPADGAAGGVIAHLLRWEAPTSPPAEELLDLLVGARAWRGLVELRRGDIVVPEDASPPRTHPGVVYAFQLLKPIPEPGEHDGFQRYRGRCRDGTVLEFVRSRG